MELNDYVPLAVRTESKIDNVVFDLYQLHVLFDLAIASTQLMDLVKKNVYYGKPIDKSKWINAVDKVKYCGQSLTVGFSTNKISSINENPLPLAGLDTRLFHSAVGIFTEAGEMLAALHNVDNPLQYNVVDSVNLQEEAIDCCWYIAILHDALGLSWEDGLDKNIAKLKARYPNKFDKDRAVNRDLDVERKILEGGDVSK